MAGRWKSTGEERVKLLRQQCKLINRLEVRVGWMENARYPAVPGIVSKDGKKTTKDRAGGEPVAGIAVVQEYGSEKRGIPSRSFMRSTQAERKVAWDSAMKKGFSAVMQGKRSVREVLDALGALAAGDVRKKITLIYTPPLATSTLRSRARRAGPGAKIISIKPLNGSGYMLATLTHVVVEDA